MRFTEILKTDRIRLNMESTPPDEREKEHMDTEERLETNRKKVIGEMADLLARSGDINNRSKLFEDLYQREKRSPTAIGRGVALPHVRTMKTSDLVMAAGRSPSGFYFASPDDQPVSLFLAIVGPPYDDSTYLKFYERLGEMLQDETLIDKLMSVEEPGIFLRELNRYQ